MALVAVAMVAIIAMAGLSIDIGTLYEASAELQRAADAGALAAARTISMQGVTGDPNESQPVSWSQVCGGTSSPAYLAAAAAVGQNPISGTSSTPTPDVTYSYAGASSWNPNCSSVGGGQAGVNLLVTVKVTQPDLPTYFSRIWGKTGNSVSASATAEIFNSSNSGVYAGGGSPIPVRPRCVKPLVIPNLDPVHSGTNCVQGGAGCIPWVDPATGVIQTPGMNVNGGGVIGERFWLMMDCAAGSVCSLQQNPPEANYNPVAPYAPNTLEYLPGQASSAAVGVPSDGTAACSTVAAAVGYYAQAIAGCDQSTSYQCGVQLQNTVDLSENPGASGDVTNGVQCLIHESTPATTSFTLSGQDAILPLGGPPPSYPFQIQVGSSNPLLSASPNAVPDTGVVTSSNSIISLPIYDSSVSINATGTTPITVIGFLQVFINVVDPNGNLNVTVLNVSGCGNVATSSTPYLSGTSPVPVRLVTPQ
jgi:Flp pilus assembly protein TadG